jgi:hypothetical protein
MEILHRVSRLLQGTDQRATDITEIVNTTGESSASPTHRPRSTPQKHYFTVSGAHPIKYIFLDMTLIGNEKVYKMEALEPEYLHFTLATSLKLVITCQYSVFITLQSSSFS